MQVSNFVCGALKTISSFSRNSARYSGPHCVTFSIFFCNISLVKVAPVKTTDSDVFFCHLVELTQTELDNKHRNTSLKIRTGTIFSTDSNTTSGHLRFTTAAP